MSTLTGVKEKNLKARMVYAIRVCADGVVFQPRAKNYNRVLIETDLTRTVQKCIEMFELLYMLWIIKNIRSVRGLSVLPWEVWLLILETYFDYNYDPGDS